MFKGITNSPRNEDEGVPLTLSLQFTVVKTRFFSPSPFESRERAEVRVKLIPCR
jgi:hypothetical protein